MKHDEFGDRMKEYEAVPKRQLMRRIPVIIRVDGKAFHSFCKRFEKPHDEFLHDTLNSVMQHLCQNIQGAKFAERHSDEISILVTDYDRIGTSAFFDYEVDKINSVVASMTSTVFCKHLMAGHSLNFNEQWPNFDCRCFNIPEHEIPNYLWWRMGDGKRNSISMLAQSKFSHKELMNKSCNEMQEMLYQKQINWANLPQGQKIGYICIRRKRNKPIPAGPNEGQIVERSVWEIEESPPTVSELRAIIDGIEFRKEE